MVVGAFGTMRLKIHPGSHSASAAFYVGYPDYWEMKFLEAVLRPGDGFLDVGANVGVYTLLAASRTGTPERIWAVEPAPETVSLLRENLELNGLYAVQVVEAALGAAAGEAIFEVGHGTTNRVAASAEHVARSRRVPIRTAASLFEQEKPPEFAKVDVEGYELEVLRGALPLIEQRRPAVWLLEANGSGDRYGASWPVLRQWLESHGARLQAYDPARRLLLDYDSNEPPGNVLAVFDPGFVAARIGSPYS